MGKININQAFGTGLDFQNNIFGISGLLTGAKYVNVHQGGITTGDTDLYTCPSGKKAVVSAYNAYNASGVGNISFYFSLKRSSVYYRLNGNTTLPNASRTSSGVVPRAIVLEAGDGISVNTATNNGFNVWMSVIEFDDTSSLKSSVILSLASGDNTLYTVPASHSALIVSQGIYPGSNAGLSVSNSSGGAVNITPYIVNSGGSKDTTNIFYPATSVADVSSTEFILNTCLDAGDFIVINTDTASNQTAWVTYYEIPL